MPSILHDNETLCHSTVYTNKRCFTVCVCEVWLISRVICMREWVKRSHSPKPSTIIEGSCCRPTVSDNVPRVSRTFKLSYAWIYIYICVCACIHVVSNDHIKTDQNRTHPHQSFAYETARARLRWRISKSKGCDHFAHTYNQCTRVQCNALHNVLNYMNGMGGYTIFTCWGDGHTSDFGHPHAPWLKLQTQRTRCFSMLLLCEVSSIYVNMCSENKINLQLCACIDFRSTLGYNSFRRD